MERDSRKNQQREKSMETSGLVFAMQLLADFHSLGVRTLILCPGGRNAPLIQAVEILKLDWEVLTFVDERSAAFFALGRSKRDLVPVVVSVTSGTALAELLPAVIEAHATQVPLILLSADRPRSHRGSGSPQSMNQVGLFTQYAPTLVDWEEGETFPQWIKSWSRKTPIHLNLCFQEPLWIKEPTAYEPRKMEALSPIQHAEITTSYPQFKKPLILVGQLDSDEMEIVEKFCQWFEAPVLAEASSQLRSSTIANLLYSGDQAARRWLKKGEFDGVIRLGGVPSWRIWRDLEFWDGSVVSFGRSLWSGLPNRSHSKGDLKAWLIKWMSEGKKSQARKDLIQEDRLIHEKRNALIEEFPKSEAALIRKISIHAAPDSMIYLGNSRPIRDWNEHALQSKKFDIQENRGINGIDGQISSFYGHCKPHHENWAIIGDLTALYDMQGPWALKFLDPEIQTKLVIMNNSGGQIFSRMFPAQSFINSHELNFQSLAQFWGMSYSNDLNTSAPHCLIELKPDFEETQAFKDKWEAL
ncbi:MAG: 2-succinyl-5-enolpyruvyl-6-hydroxy-3-cyclohexene-1-carboxylic-acid synthase [Bacteriovoracaceae bacterium]|nr:2-succinyl-5-enolpyruvyl-6-hydroxy-3-cyclohexene-1-carboxylic-acid synthase [Bacteriovoracaceae bacterium]